MPITKTMAYKVGDQTFTTFEEAKVAAISEKLVSIGELETDESMRKRIAQTILDHAKEIVDILDSDPESEKNPRKPRSDKGTKRKKEMTAEEVK